MQDNGVDADAVECSIKMKELIGIHFYGYDRDLFLFCGFLHKGMCFLGIGKNMYLVVESLFIAGYVRLFGKLGKDDEHFRKCLDFTNHKTMIYCHNVIPHILSDFL